MSDFAEQATHHVRLVLDNDERLYFARRELILSCDGVQDTAAALRDWCEELCFGDDAAHNLATELLLLALAWVDWDEMARGYIAEECES